MSTTTTIDLVEQELIAVNDLIRKRLKSPVELINAISEHIITGGGKRTRPRLLILVAKALGIKNDDHIEMAAIVELVHTATLLHDDVVDGSKLRRGLDTANALWGAAPSVLVGDYLYSRAFQLMVNVNNMQVMDTLATATNIISEGEVLQLMYAGNPDVTEEQYLEVIRCKTAELFRASTKLGALAAKASDDICLTMANYGLYLGMAYQITDDILDYTADSKTMGKNMGDDLAEGKPTLPLIYLMKQGTREQSTMVREAISNKSAERLTDIQKAITQSDALKYCRDYAQRKAQKAIEALRILPKSNYTTALHELAEFSYQRAY